ncbi:hypothetical protein CYMTET_10864 [Cymbomonas tetramitiformis]|nr:hypothetical protein CYMTET_10864 [Cymbomonas tetramitiformis]
MAVSDPPLILPVGWKHVTYDDHEKQVKVERIQQNSVDADGRNVTTIICADCGTQKSRATTLFITGNPDAVVVVVSARRAAALDFKTKCKNEGLELPCYLDKVENVPIDPRREDKVIVQIDSIWRLLGGIALTAGDERPRRRMILILDELTEILNLVESIGPESRAALVRLYERADLTVCLCADCLWGDRIKRLEAFVSIHSNRQINLLEYKARIRPFNLRVTTNFNNFSNIVRRAMCDAKSNQPKLPLPDERELPHRRIGIICGSVKLANKLHEMALRLGLRAKLYTGKTNGDQKLVEFQDVDKYIRDADVLIVTSTFALAVDIRFTKFRRVFFATCALSSSIRVIVGQGLNRWGRADGLLAENTVVGYVHCKRIAADARAKKTRRRGQDTAGSPTISRKLRTPNAGASTVFSN